MSRLIGKLDILKHIDFSTSLKMNKLVYVFGQNEKNVLFIDSSDKVYAYGNNDLVPKKIVPHHCYEPSIVSVLCEKSVIDFGYAHDHMIARTIDGRVYLWDSNNSTPQLNHCLSANNTIDTSCGKYYSLALTKTGEVYAVFRIKKDISKEKGRPSLKSKSFFNIYVENLLSELTITKELIIVKVVSGKHENFIAISCGSEYAMALTNSGKALYWELQKMKINASKKSKTVIIEPIVIQISNKEIRKISCGSDHNILLSNDEYVYFFPKKSSSETKNNISLIKLSDEIFTDVAAHPVYNILMVLSKEGICQVWSNCEELKTGSTFEATEFDSFHDVFINYFGITAKPLKGFLQMNDPLIPNGRYMKNHFEGEKIGRGSFGKVYETFLKSNRKKFAVKKIPVLDEKDFIRELATSLFIGNLECNRLIKYYEVWYEQDFINNDGFREYRDTFTLYIQMELSIKTLEKINELISADCYFKSGNKLLIIGYFLMSELFVEILEGVKFLHSRQLIHRDLKPANILLKRGEDGGYVKIADFGLAKVHDKNIKNTVDKGTVKYMAPEVVSGEPYDTKADIYSLGVIMKELFHVNYNRDEAVLPLLSLKYFAIKDAIEKMSCINTSKRPTCTELLNDKRFWAFKKTELKIEKEIENIVKCERQIAKLNHLFPYDLSLSDYSFLFSMIKSKLS